MSVKDLLPCTAVVHMQWFFFVELLASKQRDLCLLWKVLCNQSSWTYSHVMLWLNNAKVHGSLCVGALLSLISFVACATCSCSTKGHPGSLSSMQI